MLLSRTNAPVGTEPSPVSFEQPVVRWEGLRLLGGSAEPVIPVELLLDAIGADEVERFRPLLPISSQVTVDAYRKAVADIDAHAMSEHYTEGLQWFYQVFIPHLKQRMSALTGGVWQLDNYIAYAAGSDVDLMTHLIEAIASREPIALYPADWYGFLVGCTHPESFVWTRESQHRFACLCIPSVRNGQTTEGMKQFLQDADTCLLNINLFPTLAAQEREDIARQLLPILPKSVISISFSRGFGLTASQLGVFLLHKDHPFHARFASQWNWFTYFFNRLAASAFMAVDLESLQAIDHKRRAWVCEWLLSHKLPVVETGSYYVKSFRIQGELPLTHRPLLRGDTVRLCFKPPF